MAKSRDLLFENAEGNDGGTLMLMNLHSALAKDLLPNPAEEG
jgi:hypothetical protein